MKNITLPTNTEFFRALFEVIKFYKGSPEDLCSIGQINPLSGKKNKKEFLYQLGSELVEVGRAQRKDFYKKVVGVDYNTPFEKVFDKIKNLSLSSDVEEMENYFSLTEDTVKKKTIELVRFNTHLNTYKKIKEEITKNGYRPVGARELLAYLETNNEMPSRWFNGEVQIGAIDKLSKTKGGIRSFFCVQIKGYNTVMVKNRGIGGGISPNFFWACEKIK